MPCRPRLEQRSVSFCYQLLCYLFSHEASRTRAKLVNGEIQVAGDQWPIFLYANYTYDAEDPWNGLLRSGLLISVDIINHLFF